MESARLSPRRGATRLEAQMRGTGGAAAAACKAVVGVHPPGNPPPPAPGSSPEEPPAYNSSDGRRSSGVKKHHHKHNLKHRYELLETLGRGTYGKVKKAIERHSSREVSHSASISKMVSVQGFW